MRLSVKNMNFTLFKTTMEDVKRRTEFKKVILFRDREERKLKANHEKENLETKGGGGGGVLPSLAGGGITAMILSIWSMVEEPGNMGLPSSISPRMQPRLHMSTPSVYLWWRWQGVKLYILSNTSATLTGRDKLTVLSSSLEITSQHTAMDCVS